MHMYFASAVLTTLFQWSLAVSMLAVGTKHHSCIGLDYPQQ